MIRNLLLIFVVLFCGILSVNAQMLADFETPETTPAFSAEGETMVKENPDKTGINESDKAGFYNKIEGNWHFVTMDFSDTVQIGYNNTLTFKLRASTQGRIFAKFWIGDEILIESWAPEYSFQPMANNWTECKMDMTAAMGLAFTKLELAACVDNEALAEVYFDDVLLSNPDMGDGTPKASFIVSSSKALIGDEITFDASASFDFDGEIVDYVWDFGDGTTGNGKIVKHSFLNDDTYKVMLTVTDDEGKSSTDSKFIFILNAESKIGKVAFVDEAPEINQKIEAVFQIQEDYNNVYNPDEIMVDAQIEYPDGSQIIFPCFYYIKVNLENTSWVIDTTYQAWMLRFMSEQTGEHKVKIIMNDANGQFVSDVYSVNVVNGIAKGIVRNDAKNNQYYRHTTGEPYYPLGINIGWNTIEGYTQTLDNLSVSDANFFRYWHTPFAQQALEWKPTSFYDGIGFYSQEAAAMSDNLLNQCEEKDMYMQLTIFQHGMFSENVDAMWEDNPYNTINGGYVERAEEYFYNDACKAQTKKLLRYIVARYAYSKNLFAWEFFNEVQFTGIHNSQTSKWFPGVLTWHSEMSQYVQSIDPFNHIMTTVAEHDQIPYFDSISALDNMQYHLYSDNLLNDQIKLDNHFKEELKNHSIINGEYGTNNEAETPFDMQQHAIWNSIMTQVPHLMWIWGHYTELAWAGLFTMPADYLKDEDFSRQDNLNYFDFTATHESKALQTIGISNGKDYYGYVYDANNGKDISKAKLNIANIPFANYTISFYLPASNKLIVEDTVALIKLSNAIKLPDFSNGMAFKIKYQSKYTLPIALAGTDTIVSPGMTVEFSGDLSFSQVSESTLTYLWAIDEKPETSNLEIDNASNVAMAVVPDVSGIYKISLVVNDGYSSSVPDVVTITVSNVPVAVAGNDTIVSEDEKYFHLDGSKSYDADGDALTYLWRLVKYPSGSKANILSNKKPNAIIELDVQGEYLAELTVNDGITDSKPDTIKIIAGTNAVHYGVLNNLKLYPNPTNDELFIEADELITEVSIYTISGKEIYLNQAINNDALVIDMLGVTANKGIYIVKISSENSTVFKKVMLK